METIKIAKLGENAVRCKCIKAREKNIFGGVVGQEYVLDKASIVDRGADGVYADFYQEVEGTEDEVQFIGVWNTSRFQEIS